MLDKGTSQNTQTDPFESTRQKDYYSRQTLYRKLRELWTSDSREYWVCTAGLYHVVRSTEPQYWSLLSLDPSYAQIHQSPASHRVIRLPPESISLIAAFSDPWTILRIRSADSLCYAAVPMKTLAKNIFDNCKRSVEGRMDLLLKRRSFLRRGSIFKKVQILAEKIVKYLGLLTERVWESCPHDTWVNILRRRHYRQASEVFAGWEMYKALE